MLLYLILPKIRISLSITMVTPKALFFPILFFSQ